MDGNMRPGEDGLGSICPKCGEDRVEVARLRRVLRELTASAERVMRPSGGVLAQRSDSEAAHRLSMAVMAARRLV